MTICGLTDLLSAISTIGNYFEPIWSEKMLLAIHSSPVKNGNLEDMVLQVAEARGRDFELMRCFPGRGNPFDRLPG